MWKGKVLHPGLVPEGLAGGQQRLGINVETDGEPVRRRENPGSTVHPLKVAQGQVADPDCCIKSAVKLKGAVNVHPEVPDQVPCVGVKAAVGRTTYFCTCIVFHPGCQRPSLLQMRLVLTNKEHPSQKQLLKQNYPLNKGFIPLLKLQHNFSDVHMRQQISIPLNVMESPTLYGMCDTHKSPLGGPERTLSEGL